MGTNMLLKDLLYAIRSLRKSTGLAIVAIVVLTLGIGANAAIFSVVDAVLLRPLPYPEADRIVCIEETYGDGSTDSPSPATFVDFRDQSRSFDHVAAFATGWFNLSGEGEPERLAGATVTGDFFDVLGVHPATGSWVSADASGERTIVLSDGLWRRRYAAQPVIGRHIRVGGESLVVTGVMPRGFQFPESAELWVSSRFAVPEYPLEPTKDPTGSRTRHYFDVVGRLAPGSSAQSAGLELDAIAKHIAAADPSGGSTGLGARTIGLRESLVGDVRPSLLILFGAVGFVLLITCANVANLLLGRAAARRREMATRAALGAGRWRLVRQVLVESVLLSAVGGMLGLLVAVWTIRPLASLAPASLLGAAEPSLDWRVLLFAVAASLVTGVAFGLLPALHMSQVDLGELLNDAARGSTGGKRQNRVRSLLVVGEIAVSLVLLVCAGLMLKSLARIGDVNPGFQPHGLLTAQIGLPPARYSDAAAKRAFFDAVLERVRALPGVVSAGATTRMPLTGGNSSRGLVVEGFVASGPDQEPEADYRAISPEYYRTMGIPLREGREFASTDSETAPAVTIVNETFVRRYIPNGDPIGKHVTISGTGSSREIVGVVGDVHHADLVTPVRPEMSVPFAQDPWPFMTLAIRTESPGSVSVGGLQEAVRAVDADQPIARIATMEQLFSRSTEARRFNASLLSLFAAVALALAALGVYGVVSFTVAERTHEIGIRMALGADRGDVVALVLRQAVGLAAGGVAFGVVTAFGLSRLVAGMLYGVQPSDPGVFVVVALLLAGVAVLASVIPAVRASRADPMTALQQS